jgi:hypothetical protein
MVLDLGNVDLPCHAGALLIDDFNNRSPCRVWPAADFVLEERLQKDHSTMDKFRAVARQSYLDMGMPKVGREVIGLYSTRKEAEDACIEFVKSRGDRFRTAYDDCIVELVRSS